MLGLIGGGLGLANSMFGGIKAAKERKRQDRIIREAKQRNEDFFNITRIIWIDRMYRRP